MPQPRPADSKNEYGAGQYWSDRLDANWSLQGVGYLGYSERYNQYLYQAKLRTVGRALREQRIEVSGRRMLDLGPGIGFWLRWYRDQGAAHVAGLEIAAPAVERLRAALPEVDVRQGDLGQTWPFQETFDVVSGFDVFYHITDPEAHASAVRQAARHLAPGGWLLLTDRLGREDVQTASHVCFHSLERYREPLAAESCTVRAVYPLYRLLNGALGDGPFAARIPRIRPVIVRLENMLAPLLFWADGLLLRRGNLNLLVAQKEPG